MADLYTIKPLEWQDHSCAYDDHKACTPFGGYAAFERGDGSTAFCWIPNLASEALMIPHNYECENIEDAKAKAWEHWLRMIGGALEPGGPDDAS